MASKEKMRISVDYKETKMNKRGEKGSKMIQSRARTMCFITSLNRTKNRIKIEKELYDVTC